MKANEKTTGGATATAAADTAEQAAAALGVSPLALKLFAAAGCPSPLQDEYDPVVRSQSECAAALGVSERTLTTWKYRGMPVERDGYRPGAIRAWRAEQPWPEPTGPTARDRHEATGEALRAVFKLLRFELGRMAFLIAADVVDAAFKEGKPGQRGGVDDARDVVALAVRLAVEKRSAHLRLNDAQIERLMDEVWIIV